MKRTPLARRTPLRRGDTQLRRTPIAALSAKQPADPVLPKRRNSKAATPIPAAMRLQVADRSGGVCEFCQITTAVHIHHRKLRSQGGQHTLSNLIHLCQPDHDWAHRYPALAIEQGLIVRATADPALVPVVPLIPYYGLGNPS